MRFQRIRARPGAVASGKEAGSVGLLPNFPRANSDAGKGYWHIFTGRGRMGSHKVLIVHGISMTGLSCVMKRSFLYIVLNNKIVLQ